MPFARTFIVDPARCRADEHQPTAADAGRSERIGRRKLFRRPGIERHAVIAETECQIIATDVGSGVNDVRAAVVESIPDHVRHDFFEDQTRPVLGVRANIMVFEPRAQPVQTVLQAREVVGHDDGPVVIGPAATTASLVHSLLTSRQGSVNAGLTTTRRTRELTRCKAHRFGLVSDDRYDVAQENRLKHFVDLGLGREQHHPGISPS